MNSYPYELDVGCGRDDLKMLPLCTPSEFRDSMRLFASGVTIVTAGHDGNRAGLTATAVCSVTADPPRISVLLNKNVTAAKLVMDSGALCVNFLSGDHEEIAKAFAGMIKDVLGEFRFNYGEWGELRTGSPVLSGALASLDCRVVSVFDESTHFSFLCEIVGTVRNGGASSLVYLDGQFHKLEMKPNIS